MRPPRCVGGGSNFQAEAKHQPADGRVLDKDGGFPPSTGDVTKRRSAKRVAVRFCPCPTGLSYASFATETPSNQLLESQAIRQS